MTEKIKLIDHRQSLSNNSKAYVHEIEDENIDRLIKSLIPHLKNAGYSVSLGRSKLILQSLIRLLFDAQENRPFFHVEGTELPLCWNSPKDWDKNYIKYEWGHLRSRNQAQDLAHSIENLGLYSARCNQHIQTSMNIEELMVYGGILAQRISNVLTHRRKLFESKEWQDLVGQLNCT
ncbi:hypothetical protein JKP28_20970 [Vibrio vulnificus]|uniref:hypothetical protein n=1 Tax=Vibrio vulnificus TaxID=672 RepID=UPI001CDB742D|nr:hypothetical protein [Vibrio vulnificus]MCA3962509.1 hypothetical protein [Vibrio vulnificus]